jgi:hypothetical protein
MSRLGNMVFSDASVRPTTLKDFLENKDNVLGDFDRP